MNVTSNPFITAAAITDEILKGGIYEDEMFRSFFWNLLHRMIVENYSKIHSTEPISHEDWMEIEDIYSAFQDSPEHEEAINKSIRMQELHRIGGRRVVGSHETAMFRIYANTLGRDKGNPSRLNTEHLNFEENFFN